MRSILNRSPNLLNLLFESLLRLSKHLTKCAFFVCTLQALALIFWKVLQEQQEQQEQEQVKDHNARFVNYTAALLETLKVISEPYL